MIDEITFPGPIKQFVNTYEASPKLKKLDAKGFLIKTTLRGLLTLAPNAVEQSRLEENPHRVEVADKFVHFDMYLNDRLDFEGSKREDLVDLIAEAREKENTSKLELEKEIDKISDPEEAEYIRQVIADCSLETEIIEAYAQTHGSEFKLKDALAYRRVVNAVPKSAVVNILLGKDALSHRSAAIAEGIDWEHISKKYAWLFEPKNDSDTSLERTMKIMDRFTTIAQCDDDWYGRHIDEQLNIPSIAISALREFGKSDDPNDGLFNEMSAEAEIQIERSRLLKEAREVGLGLVPLNIMAKLSKTMQQYNEYATSLGKNFTFIRNLGHMRRHYSGHFAREQAYMDGKL